jgi:hypothetical protein
LEKASTDADPARVINIGSIDGLVIPMFGNYSYSASKAAIHHLTRHLAEHGDQLRSASPLGRIGRGDDIAAAAFSITRHHLHDRRGDPTRWRSEHHSRNPPVERRTTMYDAPLDD